MSRINLNMG